MLHTLGVSPSGPPPGAPPPNDAEANIDADSSIEDNKPLILIADDDLDSRDRYEYYLRMKGCRIAVAANGDEALKKARKLRPDLIVVDLSVPVRDGPLMGDRVMGGEKTTRHLKKDAATKKIPVVVLTAHACNGAEMVRRLRCEGFILKPCTPEDLLHEVQRLLKGAK